MDIDLGQLRKPCVGEEEQGDGLEALYIEEGAASRLEDILVNFQNPVFICDSSTRAAAEPYLEEEFKDYPIIELNPKGLKMDERGIGKVMKQLDYCDRGLNSIPVDVLVAIGSGTIHDLTRCAAAEYDIPFVSIPTAASVICYASEQVRTADGRLRQSASQKSPRWILVETDIIRRAPSYLTSVGMSQALNRYHEVQDRRTNRIEDEFLRDLCEEEEHALRDVERNQDDIREGDADALEKLMYALIVSGLVQRLEDAARQM